MSETGPAARSGRILAIVAGSGDYPLRLARLARQSGWEPFIAALDGAADPSHFTEFETEPYRLGQLGRFLDLMKRRGIGDILMIGALPRPSFGALAPEFSTLKYLPYFAKAFQGGDDHLLRGVVQFFEGQGLRVHGPAEIAPALVAGHGTLGRIRPSDVARSALAQGRDLLAAISPFDIGQAAVLADHRVIAVEGAEGTDAMIERAGALIRSGRVRLGKGDGVLVKAPKLGQDLRVDMPAVGPQTLERAAAAGLAGIALKAGGVLLGDRASFMAQADAAGLFVEGFA